MQRIFIVFSIFLLGCGTTPKIATPSAIGEKNKDVFILSNLIGDHLRRTPEREFTLNELIENDTLKRISSNFELTELKNYGGYISVYYKLSEFRNNEIELTNNEKERMNWIKWASKDSIGQYDGEIRFDFGERFYRTKKIIIKN